MVSGRAARHGLRNAAELDHDGAPHLIEQRLERLPDGVGDARAPSSLGWMPSAWFSAPARPPVEQERHEQDPLLARDVAERLRNAARVLRAEVRRRFHAGEEHDDVRSCARAR